MAVTQAARHITMTATGDTMTLEQPRVLRGLTFQGTGLTAGQRVLVRDDKSNILADYVTEAATDNADFWGGRPEQAVRGLSIDAGTVAGTWVVTAFIVD